jgi:hypothetical protein
MSQRFRKFEVAPTTWKTLQKKIQKEITTPEGTTEWVWNQDLVSVVVELGCLCQEWGTDAEGNQTCIKQSTKVSIDIVWVGEPLADFNQYLIWPNARWRFFNGVHAGHRVRSSVLRGEPSRSLLSTTTTANKSFLNKH